MPSSRRRAWCTALAVSGPVVFTGCWLVLGRTHAGYSWRSEPVSALSAHGAAHWPWMVVGQLAFAAGCLALAVLARWSLARPGLLAAAMLALVGYGIVQASVFRTTCKPVDARWCPPPPPSSFPVQQWMHGVGTGIAFGGLLLACLATLWAARRAGETSVAVVSAAAVVVSLPILAAFLESTHLGWHGLAERTFLLILSAWVVTTALLLDRWLALPQAAAVRAEARNGTLR